VKSSTLAALKAAHEARHPVAFAKRLTDGAEYLLPDTTAPEPLNLAGIEALNIDRTGIIPIGGENWFIEARNPAPRILIVGAVQIAQPLLPMAALAGFSTYLIDPRQAFATEARFPGAEMTREWPDIAFASLKPDRRSAVVVLTHDPKLDDPALDAALKSEAFYIGALGSRKTHAARLDRLRGAGHAESALMRICGPVGLDIGAVGAAEIALSILAEIVAVRRRRLAPNRA